MAKTSKLREYKAKRRFAITPEPQGATRLRAAKQPRFVVQKHAASHLHYDFRLEVDGVLASWAVPKGPSMDPAVKRLAMQTEDHPLDYLQFEGVIPAGQYGGGTVIVWDIGTYVNLKFDPAGKEVPMRACLEHGHLDFWLKGKRLQGAFSLIRTRSDPRPQWLLMKKKDKAAHVKNQPVDTEDTSVISGRTLEEMAAGKRNGRSFKPKVWSSDREEKAAPAGNRLSKAKNAATSKRKTSSSSSRSKVLIRIGRKELTLSNLDKVLYPKTGFTKGQVIDYYARIADVILPHLKNRAVTLKRYPDGVDGESFYQKNCPAHRPDWLATHDMKRGTGDPKPLELCVINDKPSLIYIANLASIELHTYLAKTSNDERPTMMVFDLDPGPQMTLLDCLRVGREMREALNHFGLQCFAKTSGKKGLHLAVPLNNAVTFEQTKTFARAIAQVLERENPKRLTTNMSKSVRGGRIFIDWSQNDRHKTTVGAYSMRAFERPTVSAPVTWDEIDEVIDDRDATQLISETSDVLKRAETIGDPFEPVLKLKQKLPSMESLAR